MVSQNRFTLDIFYVAKTANAAEDAKKPPPGGREAAEVREDQTSKSGSSFSTWMLVIKALCSGS